MLPKRFIERNLVSQVNKFLLDTNVLIRLIVKDDDDKFRTMMELANKVENHELT